MKPINCFMFSLVVIFSLSGCTSTLSLNPVGTNPLQIQKEDDWEGVWLSDFDIGEGKQVFSIWVKDKDKGILRIGRVGRDKEEEDFNLVKFDVQLRQGKSAVFGNIFEEGDKPNELLEKGIGIRNSYLWFMINNVDGRIIIHLPKGETFKELVKEGKLKGETGPSKGLEPGDIVICEPTDKITEFIDSYDDSGKLFEWKHPFTFGRIRKGL